MFAVFVAFLSPLSYALTDLLDAHISNSVFKRIGTMVFYSAVTNILVVPFLFFFGIPKALTLEAGAYVIAIALIEVLYQFPYYVALRRIDTSINIALLTLGQAVVPFLAFFIVGEKLPLIQYLGFGIIIAANLMLSYERGAKFKINSAFWLMLSVSLMLALQVVLYKKAIVEYDWVTVLFWESIISNFFAFGLLVPTWCRRDIICQIKCFRKKWFLFIGNEVFNQVACVTSKYALSVLPVVVFCAIDATQALFVLGIGIFLRVFAGRRIYERIDRRNVIKKTICYLLIVAGVVMTVN